MELHKSVNIHFGGLERPLHLGTLKPLKASVPVKLFEHISPEVRPIAVKSIRYSQADQEFIAREIRRLLQEDVIEKSTSPWRAQVVVARNESTGKKFVCWSGIATTIVASRFCVLPGKFLPVSSCTESVRLLTEFYLRVNVAFAPLEVHQTWYFH